MRPDVRVRWTTALRSGRYVQGCGRLRYETPAGSRFCCLGVLCELAREDGVVELVSPDDLVGDRRYYRATEGHRATDEHGAPIRLEGVRYGVDLPPAVVRWAGLDDPADDLGRAASDPPVPEYPLSAYNDGDGPVGPAWSFDRIADLIEEHL